MESVLALNESGPEMRAEVTAPVPFPVRIPPRVVLAVPPLVTASVPVKRLVPIDVVALTFPLWSVARRALEIPENQVVPRVASVLDALAKVWSWLHAFPVVVPNASDMTGVV